MGGFNDGSLKEELETCKHVLVDFEMENGRRKLFNFGMDTLITKFLLQNLDVVFDSLRRAAKLNVASGFAFRNIKDGSCRYYYAHENSTLPE